MTASETQAHEDPITRCLIVHLRRDRVMRDSPLHIASQLELLPDEPGLEAVPEGYLDIAILFLASPDKLCLALECKRLNVIRRDGSRASLAGEYVRLGMMRFVRGQYSREWPLGGMIGYVMNGELETAYTAIKGQINKHAGELLCDLERMDDRGHPQYFSTEHNRPTVPILLHHLLLPVN